MNGKIVLEGLSSSNKSTKFWLLLHFPLAILCYQIGWHFLSSPTVSIPLRMLRSLYALGVLHTVLFIYLSLVTLHFWIFGFGTYLRKRKWEKRLRAVFLNNALGFGPTVVRTFRENFYREVVTLRVPGIGADRILASKSAVEAALGKKIEGVREHANPRFVDVLLESNDLPRKVLYENLGAKSTPGKFFIGESREGLKAEHITELPHLLIAGTTGGGKSVFFKQAILSLLEGSPFLQLYLIDLKGGIEMKPFAALPNVKVAKTPDDALAILSAVKEEMHKRFSYLEKRDMDKIEPGRDPFDRIIVGIDEASVLYTADRKDEDFETVAEARAVTDHISKLSRAAGIHLILATQKVTKETIDTRIQENVSGRMCFKLNTIEGSVRMLGHGKAADLPAIPGRGIWQLGNEEVIVQVPYLDKQALRDRIHAVKELFSGGTRTGRQPMLLESVGALPFWLENQPGLNNSNHAK